MTGRVAALAAATLFALITPAAADLVHGTITGVVDRRLTLRADDGRTVQVDLSGVDRTARASLTVGDRIMVSGDAAAGAALAARYIDQDRSDPTRGGRLAAKPGPDDTSWDRVRGVVATVTGPTLTITSDDGRTLAVDAVRVDPAARAALARGERVTIVGLRSADRSHFTAHYVRKEPGGEPASRRGDPAVTSAGPQGPPAKSQPR